jgi:hypothetical protein
MAGRVRYSSLAQSSTKESLQVVLELVREDAELRRRYEQMSEEDRDDEAEDDEHEGEESEGEESDEEEEDEHEDDDYVDDEMDMD